MSFPLNSSKISRQKIKGVAGFLLKCLEVLKSPTRVSVFAKSELCKIAGYSCASVLTTSDYGPLAIFVTVLAEERKLHACILVRFYKVQ